MEIDQESAEVAVACARREATGIAGRDQELGSIAKLDDTRANSLGTANAVGVDINGRNFAISPALPDPHRA